jgi:hypothetical protein
MLTFDDAYEAALHRGVWVERPAALRLLRLTGPQRIWFLQNTITADVADVPPGRWAESCFLDPKGRLQAQFRVGVLDEEVWIASDADADKLAGWFESYRFRTKVDVERRASRCFTVLGSSARSIVEAGAVDVSDDAVSFGYALGDLPAADVHGHQRPHDDAGAEGPFDVYDVFRVEAGVGALGIDYTERDLPQEAGLSRAVSVEKGCYVGQETVARIHFRGHINKVLRELDFSDGDAAAVRGRSLHWDGRPVGRVTSAVDSPRRGVVGLGMVRVEPPAGAKLEVEGGGAAVVGPVPEGTKVKTG